MKKLLFALALGSLIAAPAVAESQMRIVAVDMLVLVRNHPDYDRNEKFIEDKTKDLDKKVEAVKKEGETLQLEGRRLMEQMRNPMLNDKAKADIEKQLQDLQQKLLGVEQRYRKVMMDGSQDLQEDRARLLRSTMDDLHKRLAEYGAQKGYDFILDTNAVAYFKPVYDVTDELLKTMGVDPANAKKKDSHESK